MSESRALPSAVLQTAAALGAHVLAAGCLPSARGLVVALPVSVLAVLLLTRLLGSRPLLVLTAGQLAGHGALALGAACAVHVAPTAHAHTEPMALTHVAAVVLLRAVLDRALAVVEAAVARLRPRPLAVPDLRPPPPRPVPTPVVVVLRSRACRSLVPVRGPPAGALAR